MAISQVHCHTSLYMGVCVSMPTCKTVCAWGVCVYACMGGVCMVYVCMYMHRYVCICMDVCGEAEIPAFPGEEN